MKMPRNIVICCDGTGNEIESDLSNVLKLYQISDRDDDQVVFYDSGIGTIGRQNGWTKFRDSAKEVVSGATGQGLDQNVLDAYRFLVSTYQEGDQVFLFGFSRGAYTVRVLAGFIRALGLLHPEQLNLANYALKWYKGISITGEFDNIWRFSEITKARDITIHFLGVWDTVSSVFRPNGKLLSFGFTKKKFPYTVNNDVIKIVRHAVAIDEKRRVFPADLWGGKRQFKSHKFDRTPEDQDVKEVWFAGVHSDVGGGYPESESGLGKIPLNWMVVEAVEAGLRISKSRYGRLVLGNSMKGSKRKYVEPDPNGVKHNSYKYPLKILGAHIRQIPKGAHVHESVKSRINEQENNYQPKNLDINHIEWVMDKDIDELT